MAKPATLLIGGLDPQGCAGLSVDIQTVQHHGGHPLPLVTCLTEQTSKGLTQLGALSAQQFMAQYASCVADFEISAIKIGLIPDIEIAHCIEEILKQHDVPVVMDPVLAATSGGKCVEPDLTDYIVENLLNKVTLLTPNFPELALLTAMSSNSDNFIVKGSARLLNKGLTACLVTGGHGDDQWATDYFVNGDIHFYCYQQKQPKSVRGTGCAMASSIAAQLAFGQDIRDVMVLAKAYISRGIRKAVSLGPYWVLAHNSLPVQLVDMPKLCYTPELIGSTFNFPACPEKLGIYPVVDSADWVDKLVSEGIQTIQLRIKDAAADSRKQHITQVVKQVNGNDDIAFFVNDYWQDAIDAGAYGVHLGQEDLHDAQLVKIEQAGLRLGISTHSYWELARALAINPSYIALGPIFDTDSKQMPFSPQGTARLQLWVDMLSGHYPLVAIGGIDIIRAKQLKATGVGSVAMISAITQAADYRKATHDLLQCWQ